MQITRDDFVNAMNKGYETYGHCSGVYFNPDKACGCSIGVACKVLGVHPFKFSEQMMRMAGFKHDNAGEQLSEDDGLWTRITRASDGSSEKHHAIASVKQVVNDSWPSGLVLEV